MCACLSMCANDAACMCEHCVDMHMYGNCIFVSIDIACMCMDIVHI